MTEEWAKNFMQALEKDAKTYAQETVLQQDEKTGLWFLRAFLPVFEEYDINVHMQTMLFELTPDVPQVEIIFVLTNEIDVSAEAELIKAVGELNYISPVGAFGIRRSTRSLYMRDCFPLIGEDDIDTLVKKLGTYYKLMTECLKGGYVGLRKIWTGEMTYEQTVSEGLLNRAPN